MGDAQLIVSGHCIPRPSLHSPPSLVIACGCDCASSGHGLSSAPMGERGKRAMGERGEGELV